LSPALLPMSSQVVGDQSENTGLIVSAVIALAFDVNRYTAGY